MQNNTLRNLNKTRTLAAGGVLYAPASMLIASITRVMEVCNGCGTASSKFDFIPDTIFGLYIGHCCHIHDWQYDEGDSIEDKEEADRVFLNNLLRIIGRKQNRKWYRPKRLMGCIAVGYYLGVKYCGGPAFWKGKN